MDATGDNLFFTENGENITGIYIFARLKQSEMARYSDAPTQDIF